MASKSLNRSQFLKTVSDRTGAHKRDVEHVWENSLAVIADAVKKGQAVSLTGFGKFKQRVIKARPAGMARNPFTGEQVKVAARPKSVAPKFVPAKALKEYVAGRAKLSTPNTKPMALAPEKSAPKKAAPKKKAAKKTAKKSAPKKKAAKKTAKKRR